jgi:hypothetical protein
MEGSAAAHPADGESCGYFVREDERRGQRFLGRLEEMPQGIG